MPPLQLPPEIRKRFQLFGAKGGRSRSEAKRAAGKINAAKATAARLLKLKGKK